MSQRRSLGLPRIWRIAIFGVLPTGFVALMCIGLYGDKMGFWATRPYATNILTTATGACLGIPIAVGIIQRLTSAQVESSQLKITHRILSDDVRQITLSLSDVYRASLDEIEALNRLLQHCCTRTQSLFISLYDINIADIRTSTIDDFKELEQDLNKLARDIESAFPEHDFMKTMATMYSSAWESLDNYVRPRLLEAGEPWLPRDSYLALKQQGGYSVTAKHNLLHPLAQLAGEIRHRILERLPTSTHFDHNQWILPLRSAATSLDEYLTIRKELDVTDS